MGSQITMTKLVLATLLCLQVVVVVMKSSEAATSSLAAQCASSIQEVTSCLSFASGKTPTPTKECCNAVSSMKDKQPVCLCFFIGQAHNGSAEIKSMGIQEAKLLQLPSACSLANASIAECPKLLGISPTSPAASIFMHNNMTSAPASSASSMSSSATPTGDKSSGIKHGIGLLGGFLAVLVSAFL